MISPYDEDIEWTDEAYEEMSLSEMIDTPLHYPKSIGRLNCTEPMPYELYDEHGELLEEIVKIFFPNSTFTPRELNKKGTSEYYLFACIEAIKYVVWFNNIEEKGDYYKECEKIEKALYTLASWGVGYRSMGKQIEFPMHRNDTIKELRSNLERIFNGDRPKKIISLIQEYFGIKTLNATKKTLEYNKHLKAAQEMVDRRRMTKEMARKSMLLSSVKHEDLKFYDSQC